MKKFSYLLFCLTVALLCVTAAHADTLSLPDSLQILEEEAFMGDTSITEVVIPVSVEKIQDRAFAGCTNLTSIQIISDDVEIGTDVFAGCSALTLFCWEDSTAHSYAIEHGIHYSLLNPVYPELTVGIPVQTNLSGESVTFFSFIPQESGHYVFYSNAAFTTYSLLCDSDMYTIVGGSCDGGNSDFCLSWYLNAGTQYYFGTMIIGSEAESAGTVSVIYPENVEGDLVYTENTDGTWTVIGYQGTDSYIKIPESYNGMPVTRLGTAAFAFCHQLETISIPDTVIQIGDACFEGCTGLTGITIPDSVLLIGMSLFSDCSSLKYVYLSDSISDVSPYCFMNCTSLTYVDLPQYLETISYEAFANCSSLSSITIPESTYWVGSGAFANCIRLSSYRVEGDYPGLMEVDDVLLSQDGDVLLAYPSGRSRISYTIPSGVTRIQLRAFVGCPYLEYIIIPAWVVDIEDEAFSQCPNLTIYCTSDSCAETYAIEHQIPYIIDDGEAPEEEEPIPELTVGQSAMARITSIAQTYLFSFIPPENGTYVFYSDSDTDAQGFLYDADQNEIASASVKDHFHNFYLACDLTAGEQYYFGTAYDSLWYYMHTGLIPVRLEKATGCLTLDEPAMKYIVDEGDKALFPFTPDESGNYIFSCENDYTQVYCLYDADMNELTDASISPDGTRMVAYLTAGTQYYFSAGGWSDYYTGFVRARLTSEIRWRAENGVLYFSGSGPIPDSGWDSPLWPNTISQVVINPGVTGIGDHAFYGFTDLTDIQIPDTVTSIGEWAFYDCSSLISVTIPDSVTSIGEHAFSGCSALTSVFLPNQITSLSDSMFSMCASLTHITIPDSVTEIGDYVFFEAGLIEITIPDSITNLGGEGVFSSCTSLAEVDIPDSVTSIGRSVFYGCTSLESITIPDSVTEIGYNAFCCAGLKQITIPDSIEVLREGTFSSCSSLEKITFPDNFRVIGSYVFSDCTSLTTLNLPTGLEAISMGAFSNCTGLTNVTIPYGVTTIWPEAFNHCTNLSYIVIPRSVTDMNLDAPIFYGCPNLTVYCYYGSVAETYCIEWNIPYLGM